MRFIPRFVSRLISPISSFMAAFLGSILSFLVKRPSSREIKALPNVPLPGICHQVLDESFLSRFEEIIVIGDVHGCFEELMIMLKRISNKERILKVLVGDLVNKGPKSSEVVEFMMNHREECVSVRGNHDEIVVDEWVKGPVKDKNKWISSLRKDQIEYLMNLPYTISLPSVNNSIIVHAGLIPGLQLDQMDRMALVSMRNLVEKPGSPNATFEWRSKPSEGVAWIEKWTGPQFVYFGHDAKRKLQKGARAIGLDTGCVYGNQLTGVFISGPRSGQFVTVDAKEKYQSTEKKE